MNPSEAIERLRADGMTEQAIAVRAGVSQSTINRIRHGGMSPTYEVGRRLVELAMSAPAPEARDAA